MPEYLSPGVYVEEIDAGPKPIEGVSTSTAGAVGVTAFGPTEGKPVLVTSFAEFARKFGGYLPEPDGTTFNKWALNQSEGGCYWHFPLAVKGFFDNGGQRMYVKRVLAGSATAASTDLTRGLIAEIVADAGADKNVVRVRHLFGISKGTSIKIFSTDKPKPDDPPIGVFTVLRYDPTALTITLSGPLGKDVKAGSFFVEIIQRKPKDAANKTLVVKSKNRGEAGNQLQARVRPIVGQTVTLLADPVTGGPPFKTEVTSTAPRKPSALRWRIVVDDPNGIVNDAKVKIKDVEYIVKNLTGDWFDVFSEPPHSVLTSNDPPEKRKVVLASGVTRNITAIGTRILLEADTRGIAAGDEITFIPTGKSYEVIQIRNGLLEINPPIPISRDWEAKLIKSNDVAVAEVKTAAAAGADTLELKAASPLKNGDVITVGADKFTLTADPDATFKIKVAPVLPNAVPVDTKVMLPPTFAEVKTAAAAGGLELELKAPTTLRKGDVIGIGADQMTLTRDPDNANKIGVTALPNAVAANAKVNLLSPITVVATFADWTLEVGDHSELIKADPLLLNAEEYPLRDKNVPATPADPKLITIFSHIDSGDPWKAGTSVRKLRPANVAGADKVTVRGAASLYRNAVLELDNGQQKDVRLIESIDGDTLTLATAIADGHIYREGHKVRVIEAEFSARQFVDGAVLRNQTFANLRLKDDKSPEYFLTQIRGQQDALIDFPDSPFGAGFPNDDAKLIDLGNFPIALEGTWSSLEGGLENIGALSVDDFIGEDKGPGKRTGIAALEDIDEISICLAPCIWAPSVLGALMIHCETLKDRFAIVDPPDGLDIEGIRTFREPIDTKYAALYYPWLKLRDPLSKQEVRVAPSGHLAGLYARVDVERGVHKAPANEVVRGISGFAEDVTKREQDLLNPKNINALRFFPGRGNRAWGARVLTSDAAWKYINVRRLFIYVEESLDEGTQWVVFEPNDEQLWGRVRQSISNFLETVWRSGALMGTKAQEAYFVKCDYSTMSQDDIDNGRLIVLIGIAPVKPAEFVIIRIQQKTLNAASE